jgi:hypothetical protein
MVSPRTCHQGCHVMPKARRFPIPWTIGEKTTPTSSSATTRATARQQDHFSNIFHGDGCSPSRVWHVRRKLSEECNRSRTHPAMNANEHRRCSLPTPLPCPFLLGHRAIRDDVAWGVRAGRIGLRHLFTPQTGELCLGRDGCNSSGSALLSRSLPYSLLAQLRR